MGNKSSHKDNRYNKYPEEHPNDLLEIPPKPYIQPNIRMGVINPMNYNPQYRNDPKYGDAFLPIEAPRKEKKSKKTKEEKEKSKKKEEKKNPKIEKFDYNMGYWDPYPSKGDDDVKQEELFLPKGKSNPKLISITKTGISPEEEKKAQDLTSNVSFGFKIVPEFNQIKISPV